MKQRPRIMRSDLTKPPQWFVVTRYREKDGVGLDGVKRRYLVASEKFDVTYQMRTILAAHVRTRKKAEQRAAEKRGRKAAA